MKIVFLLEDHQLHSTKFRTLEELVSPCQIHLVFSITENTIDTSLLCFDFLETDNPRGATIRSAFQTKGNYVKLDFEDCTPVGLVLRVGREISDRWNCFLLGVLIKSQRRVDFASRGFFNLDPSKIFTLSDLSAISTEVRLLVVPLDVVEELKVEDVKCLDGVLTKTSDFVFTSFYSKVQCLYSMLDEMPQICQIDRPVDIQRILCRSSFPRLLDVEGDGGEIARFPKCFDLEMVPPLNMFMEILAKNGMYFSLIAKSQVACGTPRSHFMALIMNKEGVQNLEVDLPLHVQQFHPHGTSLWKIYVVGNKIFIREEATIDCLCKTPSSNIIHFNALDEKKATLLSSQSARLEERIVRRTAHTLQDSLGLQVFGFDLIVDDNGVHFVIDINYFPSMKRVPDSILALHEACFVRIKQYRERV